MRKCGKLKKTELGKFEKTNICMVFGSDQIVLISVLFYKGLIIYFKYSVK